MSRKLRKSKVKSTSSESSDNENTEEEEDFNEEVPDDLKEYITKEVWNSYSAARKDSFKSIFQNPNCFFYRNRPPGEPQKLGPFTEEEKELFLKRIKYFRDELHVYDKLWGLFAIPFTGRFGYQCMNFYRHLLDGGEVKKAGKNSKVDPEILNMLNEQAIKYIKECLSKNIAVTQPQYRTDKQTSKSESSNKSSSSDEFQLNLSKPLGKSKNVTKTVSKTQPNAKQNSQLNEDDDVKSEDLYNSADSDDDSDYSTFSMPKKTQKVPVRKNIKGKNAKNESESEDIKKPNKKATKTKKEIKIESDVKPTKSRSTNSKTVSSQKKTSQVNKKQQKRAKYSDYESNNETSSESTHESDDNCSVENASENQSSYSSEEEIPPSRKSRKNAKTVVAPKKAIQKKKPIDESAHESDDTFSVENASENQSSYSSEEVIPPSRKSRKNAKTIIVPRKTIQNRQKKKPIYDSEHESDEENFSPGNVSRDQLSNSSEEEIPSLNKSKTNANAVFAPTKTIQNKQEKTIYDFENESDISDDTSQQNWQKSSMEEEIDESISETESEPYGVIKKRKTPNKQKAKVKSAKIGKKAIVSHNSLNVINQQPNTTNEISEIFYAPDPITNIPMEHPLLDPLGGVVMDESTWKDYFDQKFISPYFICANNIKELLPVTQVVLNEYRNQIVNIYI